MQKTYHWGILGLGSIANRFMRGFAVAERAELTACASRDLQKALAYQEKYGAKKAYDSYEKLYEDPDIDIIYVATPHPLHLEQAKAAFRAGKNVLVEKPVTVNLRELDELIAAAKENDRFLMEAMWTRLFPITRQVEAWVEEGRIGPLRQAQAAFASKLKDTYPVEGRLLNPALAGGSLLDVGVYSVTWADIFYKTAPAAVAAGGVFTDSGVDALTNIALTYPDGGSALLTCGINARQLDTGYLWGETGYIEVPHFWRPGSATLVTPDGSETIENDPHGDQGFRYEIEHIHDCLDKGLTESPVISFEASRRVIGICDEARRQIGLKYPFE